MRRSYLDYAMSVIVSRALPDVRDGLKPVHRRILFAMHELQRLEQGLQEIGRIVGDVIGKYHPTATPRSMTRSSAWPRISRCATCWWTGQGNFGSVDGDNAPPCVAHRSAHGQDRPPAPEDIDKKPSISGQLRRFRERAPHSAGPHPEPADQRPAGIAVAWRPTSRPTTKRGDRRLSCPPGKPGGDHRGSDPDHPGAGFPRTAGIIYGVMGVRDGYMTGRGRVIMRARTHFEDMGGRPPGAHRRRDSPTRSTRSPSSKNRRTGQRKEDRGYCAHPRRVGQIRHAYRHRAEARRGR